nr:family 78 glycoside hydrolase catalytic domain [Terrimicrobiaceae bacterium]
VPELGGPRRAPEGFADAAYPLPLVGGPAPQVVNVDFGAITAGLLRLDVAGSKGDVVDVLFAEELIGGSVPKPPQARVLSARFILRDGRQTLETVFNWLAFRHAQLWIWSRESFVLHRAWMETLAYPFEHTEGFASDDPLLDDLDAACERTLRLCAQDGIVDSASREQQQWIGDARESAITLHHRFPAGALHRRLIEQIGQGLDWMGSLVPRYPSGNRNVSPIPFYNLQWIRSFADYWWFTGAENLERAWWPNILHAVRWFSAFVNADGLLERVPHWMYIELGEGPDTGRQPGSGAINTSLNLVYLDVLRSVRDMGRRLTDDRFAEELGQRIARLESALRDQLWDESAGAYVDAAGSGRATVHSEGTAAHALLHLEPPGSPKAERILAQAFTDPHFVRASPFAMNFVLRALDRHRQTALGLKLIRERYRNFVRTGTTWEHWESHHLDPGGFPVAHSFSHAWGAAPLAFLVRAVCGIRPDAPGWRAVTIRPDLAGLQHAAVSIRTPQGILRASWRQDGGRTVGTVSLPEGITAAVPDNGTQVALTVSAPD